MRRVTLNSFTHAAACVAVAVAVLLATSNTAVLATRPAPATSSSVRGTGPYPRPALAPIVNVTFFSESMCPDCQFFIVGVLEPVMQSVGELFEVDMVPYGNAHTLSNGTIQCQHGDNECVGNRLQTCAMRLYPSRARWFPFVYCVEQSLQPFGAGAAACAQQAGLDFAMLNACASSDIGHELHQWNGARTPPLPYGVPTVYLNGVEIDPSKQVALKTFICKAFAAAGGSPVPANCSVDAEIDLRRELVQPIQVVA